MKNVVLSVSVVSLLACLPNQIVSAVTAEQKVVVPQAKHTAQKQQHKITAKPTKAPRTNPATITSPQYQRTPLINQSSKQLQAFSLTPKVYLSGLTGSYTIGKAQTLLPFISNQNSVFYGLAEGNIVAHDGSWFVGAGLGYRKIINDRIYGGYLLADYNYSLSHNAFWVATPGLELLGKKWDFRVNGYIPLRDKKKNYVTTSWAEDFGVNKYLRYEGHSGYDRFVQRTDFESIGSGFDFTVGRVIPHFEKAKIYVGAYHFALRDAGNVDGVTGKLTYQLNNRCSLEVTDSYDSYKHNEVLLGVKIALGGGSANNSSAQEKEKFGIATRLLDEVQHGYVDTAAPIRRKNGNLEVLQGPAQKRYDNLWFYASQSQPTTNKIKASGSSDLADNNSDNGTGTYETPFKTFNKAAYDQLVANSNIGVINKYPILYFASGNYSFESFIGRNNREYTFMLPYGWNMTGRSSDFMRLAAGTERPVFRGYLDLYAKEGTVGGSNTINSLIFLNPQNSSSFLKRSPALVNLNNVQNINLRNVVIGNQKDGGDGAYEDGLYMQDSSLNLYNTGIYAYGTPQVKGSDGIARGLYAINSSINFIEGVNIISSAAETQGGSAKPQPRGIQANDTTIKFLGGTNQIIVGIKNLGGQEISGIKATGKSSIIFQGGDNLLSVSATLSQGDNDVYGIQTSNIAPVDDNPTISFLGGNNTIKAGASSNQISSKGDQIYGIYANTTVVNFNAGSNTIESTSTNKGDVYAIKASDRAIINFNGGENNLSSSFTQPQLSYPSRAITKNAYGILADSSSTANFNAGTNSIKVSNLSGERIYGIKIANKGTLNYVGGINSIVVEFEGADSGTAYGIHATSAGNIQIKGKTVTDFDELLNYYATIKHEAGTYSGSKIWWGKEIKQWD